MKFLLSPLVSAGPVILPAMWEVRSRKSFLRTAAPPLPSPPGWAASPAAAKFERLNRFSCRALWAHSAAAFHKAALDRRRRAPARYPAASAGPAGPRCHCHRDHRHNHWRRGWLQRCTMRYAITEAVSKTNSSQNRNATNTHHKSIHWYRRHHPDSSHGHNYCHHKHSDRFISNITTQKSQKRYIESTSANDIFFVRLVLYTHKQLTPNCVFFVNI